MFTGRVSDASMRRTIQKLKTLRASALPYTVRLTLRELVGKDVGKKEAEKQISRTFINRNDFTRGGVRSKGPRQRKINDMKAVLGHEQYYMRKQELGGPLRAKGMFLPIPTDEARIRDSEKRLVRGMYKLGTLKVGGSNPYFVGRINDKLGIYKRKKRKRRKGKRRRRRGTEENKPNSGELIMLHNLMHTQVTIPSRPWLEAVRDKIATKRNVNRIFKKMAKEVFKKYRIR